MSVPRMAERRSPQGCRSRLRLLVAGSTANAKSAPEIACPCDPASTSDRMIRLCTARINCNTTTRKHTRHQ
eukprot:2136592-Rhodomonas_salina.1